MKKLLVITILLCLGSHIFAQNSYRDSLIDLTQSLPESEELVDVYLKLIDRRRQDSITITTNETYFNKAVELSTKLNYQLGLGRAYDLYGVVKRNMSKYPEALELHFKANEILKAGNFERELSHNYNNIGVVYRRVDEFDKAMKNHLAALEIAEKREDRRTYCVSVNSLGNIYALRGEYESALEFFNKSLKIEQEDNNKLGLAINLNNIGECHEFMGNNETALRYYLESLKYNQEINSIKGIAISYNCIGNTYRNLNKHEQALEYYFKALHLDEELQDGFYIANSYNSIASVYRLKGEHEQALNYARKALAKAQEIGSKMQVQRAFENLSDTYEGLGKHNLALKNYKFAINYKDSILNEKNDEAINKMRIAYETDKKEQEIQLLRKDQELSNTLIARQKAYSFAISIVSISLLFIMILLFLNYRNKKQHNKILQEQNEEIESQRNNIQQSNEELQSAYNLIEQYISQITDSIKYAQKIQASLFPGETELQQHIADSFVLDLPKDIVSGDFIWFTRVKNSLVIALGDCTGHGVPGAFMSIIGQNILKSIVIEHGITEPNEILNNMSEKLLETLEKTDDDNILKDGMDVSICHLNMETKTLQFAGALQSILIANNGTLTEVKGDNISLGNLIYNKQNRYQINKIQLREGSMIYLYSDGYASQFGGDRYKKFNRKAFKDTLLKIHQRTIDDQKQYLLNEFNTWKGANDQTDDVLVCGFSIG